MTEDMKKDLIENLQDEIKGVKEYTASAAKMETMHSEYAAEGFRRIAHDEFTHADFIHELLQKHGVIIPEHTENEYQEVRMFF
jgi:rubrerythrin